MNNLVTTKIIKRNFNNTLRKMNRLKEPMVHKSLTFPPHNRAKSVLWAQTMVENSNFLFFHLPDCWPFEFTRAMVIVRGQFTWKRHQRHCETRQQSSFRLIAFSSMETRVSNRISWRLSGDQRGSWRLDLGYVYGLELVRGEFLDFMGRMGKTCFDN